MADVSQDQDGTPPRRPVLRPFSGGARGAGQGPLKPLGARRLAVSSFPTAPEAESAPAAGREDAAALSVGDAGTEAVAVASPPSVQAARAVEPDFVVRPTAEASIHLSDPAAMPLDAAPESVLDVASLENRDTTATAWDGEGIAFGSAAVAPAAASAEIDQTVHVIAELEAPTLETERLELSLERSNVAMTDDGAEAFAVVLPEVDAHVQTGEPVAEFDATEPAAECNAIEIATDVESVSSFSDAESVSVAAPVESEALGGIALIEAQLEAELDVAGVEGAAGIDASIAVSDEAITSSLGEAPDASLEWSGELESVRLDTLEASVDVVAADDVAADVVAAEVAEVDVVAAEIVQPIHTSNADAKTESARADEPQAIVVESAAPLLDVELEGFHLKPEEVREVPAPIPGFERMIAALTIEDVDGASTDVAAVAEASAAASAADEADATGAGEGAGAGEGTSWRVASAPPETLAQGDADLQEFVSRSRAQAHVLETLEAVARRVRGGEIVPTTDAGASPEAVLASVLASLLSARP